MNPWRLLADAFGTRRNRIRPIPRPTSSAATAISTFFHRATPTDAILEPPDKRLVHLHPPGQPVAAGPDHRPPEFVEPRPGRLVAAEAEHRHCQTN